MQVHGLLTFPKLFLTLALVLSLSLAVGCGSTAPSDAPVAQQEATSAPPTEAMTDAPTEVAMTDEATKAPVATIPVVIAATPQTLGIVDEPVGKDFSFPLRPDWVDQGKYQAMILEIAAVTNPSNWDPHSGSSLYGTLIPTSPRFNQLVEFDPVNPTEVIGDLASGWELSSDGTVYTFTLHDAQWHDGAPVTADDIKFSLDRITEPGAIRSRTAHLADFYERGSARVVDPSTVEVTLKAPAATFLNNIASDYMKMYPKHATENLTQDEASLPNGLIGSGPWILEEFEPKSVVEYKRNPDYFKPDRPFFDGIRFNIIGNNAARIYASLQVGQVHTTEGPMRSTYRPEDVFKIQEESNGKLRAVILRSSSGSAWILNTEKPPFDDPRVRRALFLGIDRRAAVDILYCQNDYGECFGSVGVFVPDAIQGEQVEPPALLEQVPGYRLNRGEDIAEAKSLLADAGYSDGLKIKINMQNSALTVARNEVITAQLRRDLDIDVTLDGVDSRGAVDERTMSGENEISDQTAGRTVPDAAAYLNSYFQQNIVRNPHNWSNPEVDELLSAQALELDPDKRLEMLRRIVEILRMGESHMIPIMRQSVGALMDYRIQNYHVPPSNQIMKKWDHVWWDPAAECTHPKGCQ